MPAALSALALLLLSAATPAPVPSPTPSPLASPTAEPVILFLVDNSASLPPLDPEEKRVVALEKMFSFLQGQRYRVILFGAKSEIYVDDVSHYHNNGHWTDFYFAFEKAKEIVAGYPQGTPFKMVLITDALLDPDPEEWPEFRDLTPDERRAQVAARTVALVGGMHLPLYTILVGDPPAGLAAAADPEQAPTLVQDLTRVANGPKAGPLAQRLSAFFKDDGVLVRKFIFRVAPEEGLKKVEPVVRRIVKPPNPRVELKLFSVLVLPLLLFLALLLGLLVRSFPGPGDVEVIELTEGLPVHLAVDRMRSMPGAWANSGLALLADAHDAAGTITWQKPVLELSGVGLDVEGVDPLGHQLLGLSFEELRRRLEGLSDAGTKEEKIYALNLDYMAKNFDSGQAEKILTTPTSERRHVSALDFLRAKAHLLFNDELRRKLTEPRAQYVGYGRDGERKELSLGTLVHIGRYTFMVKDIAAGGRKDVRVVLYYDRVPSLLGLKTWLPDFFQRLFRLRRSSSRVVS
jgi:hypothetical protein